MIEGSAHPTDEDLALYEAGLLASKAMAKVAAHLSTCSTCRQIVEDAARGLAILASAAEPPADLEKQVRARRWALARDDTPVGLPFVEDEDIAEVSGRGKDDDETDDDEPT
jgi:anti-sigma factor ChrR (cupin superfamily)